MLFTIRTHVVYNSYTCCVHVGKGCLTHVNRRKGRRQRVAQCGTASVEMCVMVVFHTVALWSVAHCGTVWNSLTHSAVHYVAVFSHCGAVEWSVAQCGR